MKRTIWKMVLELDKMHALIASMNVPREILIKIYSMFIGVLFKEAERECDKSNRVIGQDKESRRWHMEYYGYSPSCEGPRSIKLRQTFGNCLRCFGCGPAGMMCRRCEGDEKEVYLYNPLHVIMGNREPKRDLIDPFLMQRHFRTRMFHNYTNTLGEDDDTEDIEDIGLHVKEFVMITHEINRPILPRDAERYKKFLNIENAMARFKVTVLREWDKNKIIDFG